MSATTRRGVATPVTGAAVIAGLILTIDPGAAGADTVSFTNSCQAKSIITVDKSVATGMTVTAPASVKVGDTFTYRIQPAPSSFPNSDSGATTISVSRLKYDYAVPANTTFVSAAVVPGTAINIDNVAPNVLQVNESGAVDPAGGIIRLSGNNQVVGNSPTSSTNSEGGIRAPKLKKNLDGTANANGDSWFQLPAVDVTVTAVAAGVITPQVRTAGSAAAYGNDMNYNTSLASASLLGTQWAPTRCIPSDNKSTLNAGAGPLATVTVGAAAAVTTTTVTVPATATTGQSVDLSAAVNGTAGAAVGGTVQFQDNGVDIGSPVAVTNGTATLPYAFGTAGAHAISAVYSGAIGYVGSTAAAQTVTVSVPVTTTVPPTTTAPVTTTTAPVTTTTAPVTTTTGTSNGGTGSAGADILSGLFGALGGH